MKPIATVVAVFLINLIGGSIPSVGADMLDQHQEFLEKRETLKVQEDELKRNNRIESTQHDLEINQAMQQVSRASKIIGSSVNSPEGDYLGVIKELVINPMSGHVVYAVVSCGGLLGIGSKLFAVPWQALHWTGETGFYDLDLDKSILASSPGFNNKHWPDTSNYRDLQREVLNQFYFVKP